MADAPGQIVADMMAQDRFSQWLGVRVEQVGAGSCVVSMVLRDEMVNGFGIAHGGIAYALADSAMAFASNSHGRVAVALNNNVSYPVAVRVGQRMVATATELTLTKRTGTYDVVITVDDNTVCLFRGTVYRTDSVHEGGAQ
jgi:acyl-CoA thioesterase